MRFMLAPSANIVTVDNAPAVVAGGSLGLAANINTVLWQSSTGQGRIEYNDRPALADSFADPSPYQGGVNAWMAALQSRLRVSQAQSVKNGLIDGIYNSKRTSTITYLSHSWDASDEAFRAMRGQLVSQMAGDTTVTGGVNSALSTIAGQVNGAFSTQASRINSSIVYPLLYGGSASWSATITYITYSSYVDPISGQTIVTANYHTVTENVYTGSNPVQAPSQIGAQGISGAAVSGGLTSGNVSWLPTDQNTNVTMTVAQFATLIGNIISRRNALALNRATKKAAVNALATVAACIAYDTTAGWSS